MCFSCLNVIWTRRKYYRLYFKVNGIFVPIFSFFFVRCGSFFPARKSPRKTGYNKYDIMLETVRFLISLFSLLLNYKLWQSYFTFHEQDVFTRLLISYRHLATCEIFHGAEKLVRPIHSPRKSKGTEAPRERIISDSYFFFYIDIKKFFPFPRIFIFKTIFIFIINILKKRF